MTSMVGFEVLWLGWYIILGFNNPVTEEVYSGLQPASLDIQFVIVASGSLCSVEVKHCRIVSINDAKQHLVSKLRV
jgi:hypothetical protein